jgi:hypothetical protein
MNRRFLWTFLLALLLPFAQLAAAAHEISHVQPAVQADSKSALHGGHCEICALAAHISGGAAATSPLKIQQDELQHGAPTWFVSSRPSMGAFFGFLSRAPPNSLLT